MPQISIGADSFHVRVDGPDDGPALLLSNSLSCDLAMWDEQVAAWSREFRVVRYDQRGHGGTPATARPYTVEQLGRDALGVLDALGIAKAHWCGISLGGMTGMSVLTHAPERFDRAVLANTAAYMGPADLWNGRVAAAEAGGMAALATPTVERWFPSAFRERAPDEIARMHAMVLRTSVAGYQGCCEAIRDMDQRESIRAITAPTLVIIGSHDKSTTAVDGEFMHARIAGSRTRTIDAGHISNIECAAEFTTAVADFLRAA